MKKGHGSGMRRRSTRIYTRQDQELPTNIYKKGKGFYAKLSNKVIGHVRPTLAAAKGDLRTLRSGRTIKDKKTKDDRQTSHPPSISRRDLDRLERCYQELGPDWKGIERRAASTTRIPPSRSRTTHGSPD